MILLVTLIVKYSVDLCLHEIDQTPKLCDISANVSTTIYSLHTSQLCQLNA